MLETVEKIIIAAVPIVFAITVHEAAHGWVANRLGDSTAKLAGRLTLNPLRHVDPLGTVVVPIVMILLTPFAFGWARPVPVQQRNLGRPERDMALVAIAGPAANLVMAVCWAWLALALGGGTSYPAGALRAMAEIGVLINIVLIALNLLPLPPLDGSRVAAAFLPPATARRYNALEPWGLPILLVLIFTGVLGKILLPMIGFMLAGLNAVLGG